MQHDDGLLAAAREVLSANDRGSYTVPADGIYPHQWLWDSCFIAIGQRHFDVERAKQELLSLVRGQWANGMLPNIIFNNESRYRTDRNAWRSWLSPFSPDHVSTSGITQPPVFAEAVYQVGMKLPLPERRSWFKLMLPHIIHYHEWLYRERDPHGEGLTLQIHPWEIGMDNTPPWMAELHEHLLPWWIRALEKTRLTTVVNLFRRDTRSVPLDERFDTVEILALFDAQRRFKRKAYDIDKILDHSLFIIEDLTFNSILVRANQRLRDIAKTIRAEIPQELDEHMQLTPKALENLWDPYSNQYYSRDFITHKLLKVPSVATLLPLYAGTISKEQATKLVKMIENEQLFGPAFPLPSTPLNSEWFQPLRYWQGPTWLNINWLVIDGLERYGFKAHADTLRELSLELVTKSGFSEYFDPNTGEALGIENFSWTAALAIDMLKK